MIVHCIHDARHRVDTEVTLMRNSPISMLTAAQSRVARGAGGVAVTSNAVSTPFLQWATDGAF